MVGRVYAVGLNGLLGQAGSEFCSAALPGGGWVGSGKPTRCVRSSAAAQVQVDNHDKHDGHQQDLQQSTTDIGVQKCIRMPAKEQL